MADRPRVEPGSPTVVVDHVDITYRVLGGDRRNLAERDGGGDEEGGRGLRRLLERRKGERVREVHAVHDVSFVARHGESIGIIGRNGSGKSTILRAMAGLIPPSAGRIWVAGEPSLLGVNAVLINKLSGQRNIYIGGQALGLSRAEIDERFDDIVDFSGIGDAVYLPMSTYSSGMGARLRFAISTAAAPEVLMIDEALATGDAAFRAKSTKRIAAIREQAGTVFLVSHSNSTIRDICDRVLWMDGGRLLMDGPTAEVLAAYEGTLTRVKGPAAPDPEEEPEVPRTTRWGGRTRFQIAREVGRATWAPGVSGCFVVGINAHPVAQVVAPVAARLGWPIVWMDAKGLPPTARDELGRLSPGRVVVVGSEADVAPKALTQIEELTDGPVERVDAPSPAAIAAQMLDRYPPQDTSTIHVASAGGSGRPPVAAITAASLGRAVVVSDTAHVLPELAAALTRVAPKRLILDGYAEDWAPPAWEALRSTGAEVTTCGDEGPMASVAGLWEDVSAGGRVIVAGASSPELLSATIAAVRTGAPVLLLTSARVPGVVRERLHALDPSEVVLCGSLKALPPALRQEIGRLVDPSDARPEDATPPRGGAALERATPSAQAE